MNEGFRFFIYRFVVFSCLFCLRVVMGYVFRGFVTYSYGEGRKGDWCHHMCAIDDGAVVEKSIGAKRSEICMLYSSSTSPFLNPTGCNTDLSSIMKVLLLNSRLVSPRPG